MLSITEIKNGKKILWNNEPYEVVDYQHSKIGRAGAVLRTKLKNLTTGALLDHTFQGADKLEEAAVSKAKAQFLYKTGDSYEFMDTESYEQFALDGKVIDENKGYLVEGTEVTLLLWNEQPLTIELPAKVTLLVTDAPPGLKGDTASGGDKVVTVETGLQITTPLFVKVGDKIIINTERGTYVSRA
jgi:elongation factor P